MKVDSIVATIAYGLIISVIVTFLIYNWNDFITAPLYIKLGAMTISFLPLVGFIISISSLIREAISSYNNSDK